MLRLLLRSVLTLLATWHIARLALVFHVGSFRNNKVLSDNGWGEGDGTEIGVSKELS